MHRPFFETIVRRSALLASVALVAGALASSAWAAKKGKWRAHAAVVAVSSKTVTIADQKDHYVYLGEWDGVLFTDGDGKFLENARYQFVDVIDSAGVVVTGGDGGYKTFTAADGSQVFARFQGTEAAPPVYKGKWEFIGGTGKYNGIKGQGTYVYHSVTDTTAWDVLEGEYELP
jgi:hypothetical protein